MTTPENQQGQPDHKSPDQHAVTQQDPAQTQPNFIEQFDDEDLTLYVQRHAVPDIEKRTTDPDR